MQRPETRVLALEDLKESGATHWTRTVLLTEKKLLICSCMYGVLCADLATLLLRLLAWTNAHDLLLGEKSSS